MGVPLSEPVSLVSFLLPQAVRRLSAIAAVSARVKNFFMLKDFLSFFSQMFLLPTVFIIAGCCKLKNPVFVKSL